MLTTEQSRLICAVFVMPVPRVSALAEVLDWDEDHCLRVTGELTHFLEIRPKNPRLALTDAGKRLAETIVTAQEPTPGDGGIESSTSRFACGSRGDKDLCGQRLAQVPL